MGRHAFLFLALLAIALIAGCGGDQHRPTGAGPQLTIKEPEFNFGYTSRSVIVSHAFWLYSTGEDTLRIRQVKAGCGCTKAPLQRDVLPPGDSTALEVIYTSSSIPGLVRKTVNVYTNEEDTVDSHQLTIRAGIIPWPDSMQNLRVNPYRLRFQNRGSKALRVSIENAGDFDYEMKVIACPPELAVDCPEVIRAGTSPELTIHYVGKPIKATANKSFTLEAVGADTTRFTMPVLLQQ
ncbi:MAG: DUF1573 domain-containing protein [bacterium]